MSDTATLNDAQRQLRAILARMPTLHDAGALLDVASAALAGEVAPIHPMMEHVPFAFHSYFHTYGCQHSQIALHPEPVMHSPRACPGAAEPLFLTVPDMQLLRSFVAEIPAPTMYGTQLQFFAHGTADHVLRAALWPCCRFIAAGYNDCDLYPRTVSADRVINSRMDAFSLLVSHPNRTRLRRAVSHALGLPPHGVWFDLSTRYHRQSGEHVVELSFEFLTETACQAFAPLTTMVCMADKAGVADTRRADFVLETLSRMAEAGTLQECFQKLARARRTKPRPDLAASSWASALKTRNGAFRSATSHSIGEHWMDRTLVSALRMASATHAIQDVGGNRTLAVTHGSRRCTATMLLDGAIRTIERAVGAAPHKASDHRYALDALRGAVPALNEAREIWCAIAARIQSAEPVQA